LSPIVRYFRVMLFIYSLSFWEGVLIIN
jgi:hypothetical protein